ncbi:FecCD family ABC transporter permease [Orrella dioscoreae]|nr:iron chelate uptake ABC transporter family permease subunit [Orrella dioscoreae]
MQHATRHASSPSGISGNRNRARRHRLLALSIGLTAIMPLAIVSLLAGARELELSTAWRAITAFDPSNNDHLLLWHLRMPRTLLAIVAGAALGAAGILMQALTRNVLADPGLLGVNAGAALAIAGAIAAFGVTHPAGQLGFGLAGAALAATMVYLLGGIRQAAEPLRMVLAGAALSAVLLAATQIITVNSDNAVFDQFRHWAVGSLQGRGHAVLWPAAAATALGLLIAFAMARRLDAVALGTELGTALGARPALVWQGCATAIVLLAGAATAAAGPIAFIGLAAPHLARHAGGADHRWTLPFAMLAAALLVLAADILGRVIARPGEIPVGILSALIGGPVFVALARRQRLGPR